MVTSQILPADYNRKTVISLQSDLSAM